MRVAESATKGIINALLKNRSRAVCKSCGFPLPVYPGRYPKNCPNCGEPLEGPPRAASPAS